MAHFYPKINAPWVRDADTGRLNRGQYIDGIAQILDRPGNWIFTEKVDGTSVVLYWDGDRVSYFGHTTKSQFAPYMTEFLDVFKGGEFEGLLEQTFGCKSVAIFGERYGPKIGPGANYSDKLNFIVFDIMVGATLGNGIERNGVWLEWDDVLDVFGKLGLRHVPVVEDFEYMLLEVASLASVHFQSLVVDEGKPRYVAEGVVARPRHVLLDKTGNAVRYKIKAKEYRQ